MLGNLKEFVVITGLVVLLVICPSKVSATETKLNKEIMLSLSCGEQFKESWANGIEVHYFGEPKIGIFAAYSMHSSTERVWIPWILEESRLEQRSIGFLFRPFNSEDLVAKFGFKDFNLNYKRTTRGGLVDPVTQTTDSIAVLSWANRISGLWFELSGNKELFLLSKWIKVFGEAGVTLAKERRFVQVDGIKVSNWQVLPEFGAGLALQVVYPLRIKFGYYQTCLQGRNAFCYGGPHDFCCFGCVTENFYMREMRASMEITYR